MLAKNPRIHVVLEKPLYEAIELLARKEKVSLSMKIRNLVRESLETGEDIALTEIAEAREKTFKKKLALSHRKVWRQ
jgi:hypothetical protein